MNVFALTGDPEILYAAFPVHQMFGSHVHEKVGLHVHERVEQEELFQEKDYLFLVLLDELLHKNVEQAEAFPVPKMVEPEEQICEMFERIELVLAHSNSFGLLLGSETSGSLSAKDLQRSRDHRPRPVPSSPSSPSSSHSHHRCLVSPLQLEDFLLLFPISSFPAELCLVHFWILSLSPSQIFCAVSRAFQVSAGTQCLTV